MANLNPFTALAQEGEPAVNTGRAVALCSAIMGVIVVFVPGLSLEQQGAILTLLLVGAPLLQGYLTRAKVVPADQVAAQEIAPGVVVAGPAVSNIPNDTPVDVVEAEDEVDGL